MKLLEEVKGHSSKWMKTKRLEYETFYWQDGYGAFSANPSDIDIVKTYIENQAAHHRKNTFKEEFVHFLNIEGIEYDERYLWN